MKALSNSRECPNCGSNHKSKPFCLFENGWYCYSCGYTKAADRLKRFDKKDTKTIQLPDGCTSNLSKFSYEALLYLAERNITEDDVINNNILYKGEDNSLVFSTFDNEGNLVHYVERKLTERGFYFNGIKTPSVLKNGGNDSVLVLVEDFISAIRVSHCVDSLCLWGTSIKHQELVKCFNAYDNVLVWLDNDAEKEINSGQQAAQKILQMAKYCLMHWEKKRLDNIKTIHNIVTDKDPKYYTDTEIRRIIDDARGAGL